MNYDSGKHIKILHAPTFRNRETLTDSYIKSTAGLASQADPEPGSLADEFQISIGQIKDEFSKIEIRLIDILQGVTQ